MKGEGHKVTVQVVQGDALAVLPGLRVGSADAIVCDPPAGIAFMGKHWDRDKGGRRAWIAWLASVMAEGLRVLRPGGYAFVWALPRTAHWTATALEDAGFEIRDDLHEALSGCDLYRQFIGSLSAEQATAWARVLEALGPSRVRHLFGSGFPKSKALLKPAVEDWILCRKPGPLRHLNIDASRVGYASLSDLAHTLASNPGRQDLAASTVYGKGRPQQRVEPAGRWPANFVMSHAPGCERVGTKRVVGSNGVRGASTRIYGGGKGYTAATGEQVGYASPDGTEEVPAYRCAPGCPVALMDEQSGIIKGAVSAGKKAGTGYGGRYGAMAQAPSYNDTGTASRFFHCFEADPFVYQAKASRKDRGEGNKHPTVKSTALMRHLCRLIAAPGDLVLDPFAGSGSTGVAALAEGMRFLGIEQDAESVATARRRLGLPRAAARAPRPASPRRRAA